MSTRHPAWTERYAGALMNTFGPPKLVLTRGEGAHVWDADGREYVDLLGGIAVNALGHAHPRLVAAVTEQLQTLGHISNFFASEPQIKLAERLVGLLGTDARVFFTNSGAEANEAAFKLTRRTGRTRIVAPRVRFHGRTMGALALTSKLAYREPFEPLPGDVVFVPYGDVAALEAAVDDQTAAVLVEPIQGEAGVVVPPATTCPPRSGSRTSTARCSGSTRSRPASAAPAPGSPTSNPISSPGRWSPTSSPSPRAWPAASRSAPASPPAARASSSTRATTAPPSAATRSPPRRRSPCSTPSRRRGLLDHVARVGGRLARRSAPTPG